MECNLNVAAKLYHLKLNFNAINSNFDDIEHLIIKIKPKSYKDEHK